MGGNRSGNHSAEVQLRPDVVAINRCRALALGLVQIGDESEGETRATLRATADMSLHAIETAVQDGKLQPEAAIAVMTNIVHEALKRTGKIPPPSKSEEI